MLSWEEVRRVGGGGAADCDAPVEDREGGGVKRAEEEEGVKGVGSGGGGFGGEGWVWFVVGELG